MPRDPAGIDGDRILADDKNHVFHSWAAQERFSPLGISAGSGAWFSDLEGNRYLDFASQLVYANLGHQHPRIIEALKHQADRLCLAAPDFAVDVRGKAARMIAERAPRGLNKVFFTNGGAEANENAIRMARLHTGRPKVLAAYRSYHGATAAAATATGEPRRWGSEPGIPGVVHFIGPYPYRSSFHASSPAEEGERALAHLAEIVMYEGADSIAAILLETVVGTNGVLVPPDGYLAGVRELCDRHGIALICDEVMVGFGRVGEWFAVDHWAVVPDLITFAKGVNSGYVPLGGVILSEEIASSFATSPYPGGLTYSGHPLACATAIASMEVFEEEAILERVRDLGEKVVAPMLEEFVERHPSVGEVRGLGLFWAIELVRDRATRRPLVPFDASGEDALPMTDFANACKARGLWPWTHFNGVHVAPPLVIEEEDLRRGIETIDECLEVTDAYVTD